MKGNRPSTTDKAKDFKGTLKQLAHYLSPYKYHILTVILFAILSAAFSIIGPKIMGNATTEIFNGLMDKISGGSGIDFAKIGRILIFLLGLYAVSAFCTFVQNFLMSGVSQKIAYGLRKQISEKLNHLPMKYFDTKTHGEILSRVTNDVDTVSSNLDQCMTQMITSITTLIGVVIMMLTISPLMTLAVIIIIPIALIILAFIVSHSQKYFQRQQEYLGHVNGKVEEVYGGHNIVKAFNGEEDAREEFQKLNQTLYRSSWKSQFFSGIMHPLMNFIGNLGYVVVSIMGGYLVIQNQITVGDIQSFIQYVRNFMNPLSNVAQVVNLIQATIAAAERVFEFLGEEEEVPETEHPVSTENLSGNITFSHVKFGYNPDKTIIKDFNATVKQGQKVAIVGPTGAGKTTMVKLLMRFYDINSGSIQIDGHDIKEFKRQDLRRMFGMVLQDTWLFSGTIEDNVKYGKMDATFEAVENACREAHADHFIKTLPDSYHMVINEEGNNVSQGQKQLLTIARVILADPKILILDEATSSVDTRTEEYIQKAMDKLMENRTSFIIAHRLSTIRNADLILVMDHGDIVEQGNHEELLKKNGFYAKLYNSQFEE